ncbi:RNA-guided endonuclease IscB [Oscillatoria acuminata]|uniref:Restriction endonuclease n=1 Tax=Oscillatoria acuminata PCC 6304 TaxID=56110 RepID=K9TRF7_9CYAN|nr:RNA-guided endonuclease IscB [Oscillatoria acuminata]AFY85417.1 restriction endonuclease [Oscillatoria acuminata PCC 6304]
MHVFVLDTNKKPLSPCHPCKARQLLKSGRASVFRRYPFTIILHDTKALDSTVGETRLKIDPGSQITGLAICQENRVIWAAELVHRGSAIKDALLSRRQLRRGRRNRKTRYRKPRFLNRTRKPGWLPPSLESRISNVLTWVNRLLLVCHVTAISQELVRFDTQKLQNPEVTGVEYQQGELFSYEVREYLLTKWGRKCAYCSAENVPLEVEHIHPKSKGGSDRVSNLTLACHPCNQAKGNRNIREFLSAKSDILNRILKQSKTPLKDAAAVNATRWKLYQQLKETGLTVETGTGALTKYNRTRLNLPKTHWFDAACVGQSTPSSLKIQVLKPLQIQATGRGNRQRVLPNKYGFARGHRPRQRYFFGFKTGDIVIADIPKGKKAGRYLGRLACRTSGRFNIKTVELTVQGISHKYCQITHHGDGYLYGL